MTYNVLFPSGKVKCYYIKSVAEMYCQLYNGAIISNSLDNIDVMGYNDSIVNELETI